MASYQSKSWRQELAVLMAVIALLAGMGGVIMLLRPYEHQLQGWILAIPVILFLFLILGVMAMVGWLKRRQVGRLREELERMGLRLIDELTDADRQQIGPYIGGLAQTYALKYGSERITWFASNREAVFFEHSYTTGSGKSTQVHTRIVAAFPESVARLAGEPLMTAHRLRRGQGLGGRKRAEMDLKTGEDAFDKDWEIWGHDGTRARFLTSAVRAKLALAPRGEFWHVGEGWVACAYDADLDAENALRFFHYARETAMAAG